MQKIVNCATDNQVGDRGVDKFIELDGDRTQSLVDPAHRQEWTKHVEILLAPDHIAFQILSNVAASHVEIVIEARPRRIEGRQQCAETLCQGMALKVEDRTLQPLEQRWVR